MNPDYGVSSQSSPAKAASHKEGPVAPAIENQTAKLPSDVFLWAAGASVLGSAAIKVLEAFKPIGKRGGRGTLSIFVGMWAPTILLLGLYKKLAKAAGSDKVTN